MKTDPGLILRYLKIPSSAEKESLPRIEALCETMERTLEPGSVFRIFPLKNEEEGPRLGEDGPVLTGQSAKRMLQGCRSIAVLAVTLGFSFDKMLTAAQKRDMAGAVTLDACASAYIESVADEVEKEIAVAAGGYLTDRFSPGYGDLPLELQSELVRLTDAGKRLGVHVLDSYLLNPVKTVTALIGIADTPRPARIRGCAYCAMNKTCAFKKGTGNCEAR